MQERKRNRLKGFDYSSNNIYFVTICCRDRIHQFGEILKKRMHLNISGEIVEKQVQWLEEHYPYVELHNFVVMPNHVHILLQINSTKVNEGKTKSVSELIGAFKSTSSTQIHLWGNMDFQWQRSFHDHIVRDGNRYENIYHYITNNPARWHEDMHNRLGDME